MQHIFKRQALAARHLMLPIFAVLLMHGCTNMTALEQRLAEESFAEADLRYALVTEATEVRFEVGQTRGNFRAADAQLSFTQPRYDYAQLEVTLATASVNVRNPLIERMLKGKEWFASKDHPLARFATTGVVAVESDDIITSLQVTGTLEIKEIVQPLVLTVSFPDGFPDLRNPPESFNFVATGAFSRADYGMNALPNMAPDEVALSVNGTFSRPDSQSLDNDVAKISH
ncbi:MAG: YceI family protein [Pseudomonadota bacterium]